MSLSRSSPPEHPSIPGYHLGSPSLPEITRADPASEEGHLHTPRDESEGRSVLQPYAIGEQSNGNTPKESVKNSENSSAASESKALLNSPSGQEASSISSVNIQKPVLDHDQISSNANPGPDSPSSYYEHSCCESDTDSTYSDNKEKRLINARRQTCAVLLILALGISIYTGIAAFQLKKMVNSTFVLQHIESSSLCSDAIQFNVQGLLSNPSLASLGVSKAKISIFLQGSSLPMFTITASSPQFSKNGRKGSSVIRSGLNKVHLSTEFLVENRYLAALVFSKMISQQPIHLEMKYQAIISLQPIFLFPIELPIDGESILYPNQPGTSSIITLSTDAISLSSVDDNQSLMINLKWNIVHATSSTNISFPIPELKLAILSRGHTIALVTNDPGQYSLTSIQSTTLMIPTVRNSFQAKEIRTLTQRFLQQNLDGLTLQIAGISDDSSPVCMLQNVFNLMPPTTVNIADVVTQALRHQEQAIAVKKTGRDAEPVFTVKSAVAKIRSLERSAEHPLAMSFGASVIYSSKAELNVSLAPLKLDIGANDAAVGQITVTPLPVSVLPDGFREISLDILFDRLDESQLVSLIRDFALSKGTAIPSLKIIGHRTSGFLSNMLTGMVFEFPQSLGGGPALFGLQPHIYVDGGRPGDPFIIDFAVTNPANNYVFFKSAPIFIEIPAGSLTIFLAGSRPFMELDWNTTEIGFQTRPTTLTVRAQIKLEQAQTVVKLINLALNDDDIVASKIVLNLHRDKRRNLEFMFSDFKLSDVSNFYRSTQTAPSDVISEPSAAALELVDFLSVDYTDKIKLAMMSRLRYPNIKLTIRSFPQLSLLVKSADEASILASVHLTERVQQSQDAPLMFISSSLLLEPSLLGQSHLLITGAARSATVADVILSQIQYRIALPTFAPKLPASFVNITSNATTFQISLSGTVPAFGLKTSIRLFLQPMRIVITDIIQGKVLDIGSLDVKPVTLSYKEYSEVNADIRIYSANRREEMELARLIKRIFDDERHRFVIQLLPDLQGDIEGLIPFHSYINSSFTKPATSTSFNLPELLTFDITPIGSVGHNNSIRPDLSIPCFTRFPLCQFDRKSLIRQFGLIFETRIQALLGFQIPFHFELPTVYLSIDHEHAPMLQVSTTEIRQIPSSSDEPRSELLDLKFNVSFVVLDTETLGVAYDSQTRPISRHRPSFTVHTMGHGGNYLSRIFSQCIFSYPINWNATASSSKPSVNYSLVQTNSSSAAFDIGIKMPYELPFQIHLSDFRTAMYWKGSRFAELVPALNLPQNSSSHDINLRLSLIGDPDASPQIYNGTKCINPKMYNINKVLEAALLAVQTNSSLPILLEVMFTNAYNVRQKWAMNLTVFDEDPPQERTALPRSKFGILESMTIDVGSLFKQILHIVGLHTIVLPLKFQVKNPLTFQWTVNHMDSESYFTDSDGVDGPFVLPFKHLSPDPKVYIASVSDSNRWELHPNTSVSVNVNFLANKTGFLDVMQRFIDEQILHQRLCLHLENTKVDVELRAENHEPLLYTQEFSLKNYPAISGFDCETEKSCYPKTQPMEDFSITNFITEGGQRYPFNINGDATVSLNGSVLELTNGKSQRSSIFWSEPIRILTSWAFEAVFRMDRLSSTGKGHGLAIMVQGEGPLARSRSKWGIKLGSHIPELSFVLNNDLKNSIRVYVNGTKLTQTFRPRVKFDDGKYHRAQLVYSHLEQRFDLFIDKMHVLVILYDLKKLWMPNESAWIGITASSGFIKHSRQVIREMKLLQPESDLIRMRVVEDGRMISSVGQRGHFTLDSRDTCDMPLFARKSNHFDLALSDGHFMHDLTDVVEDDESGLYSVPVLLDKPGTYQVLIKTEIYRNMSSPWVRIGQIRIDTEHG